MLLVAWSVPAVAQTAAEPRTAYAGRPVAEVLDELRDTGLALAWSSRLVTFDLVIDDEPIATNSLDLAVEILAPHGLTLRSDAGVYLVVREETAEPPAVSATAPAELADPEIENITVSASRYEISRDVTTSNFVLDRRTIQNMPDTGEDPVRITHRLPGSAASGASARAHFRGGEQSEVGIILNGQRLFDPFHVRDYQNIFSAIDSRAIEGVEVYTGGFPVRFGDRMSGLVLMNSLDTEKPRHTEIGISVFNTSVLHAGDSGDRRWLVSARRGNLDLVLDKKFGRPSYYDVFAEFQVDVTPDMTFSANAFYADDLVTVVLETDPAELEQAQSRTRNGQAWLQLENRWSDRLTSNTLLSFTTYTNRRIGDLNDPEKIVGDVVDVREVDQVGLRQDWSLRLSDQHLLQWGFAFTSSDAKYDYTGQAEYFELQALYENQPATVVRNASARPSGGTYAAYFADRRRVGERTVVEWGLRWDDQTYTDLASDSQLSPRLSVLRSIGDNTDLRLSWGRYHQSQGIQELQIEDGITNFWPAQRADHLIAGLTHRFANDVSLRIEAFHKDMQHVRPRFENLFDPLGLIPELQPDRVRLDPLSAQSAGIELSLQAERGDWSWWGSYTASRVTDSIDGRDVPRSWDQRHAVQAGVHWSGGRWDLAIAAGAHSGWPKSDLSLEQRGTDPITNEPIFVAVPGPRNALHHGMFASVDFRLSRTFDVKRGSLMAFVEVSNVFNRRNTCCVDWDLADTPAPELEFSNDYWLPLLPAIGILWEF